MCGSDFKHVGGSADQSLFMAQYTVGGTNIGQHVLPINRSKSHILHSIYSLNLKFKCSLFLCNQHRLKHVGMCPIRMMK